jgi:fucose permease
VNVSRPVGAVYLAGLLQGLALVTFPAASAVFTSSRAYDLSNAEYGVLFAPQIAMSVATSVLGERMAGRWGRKCVLILGLAADVLSMALLVASRFALATHAFPFGLLLTATTFMGVGFGMAVPALNAFATLLFPDTADAAVLALNALLGLGTALAPVLVALFVGLGAWWGLPLAVGGLLVVLIVWSSLISFPHRRPERPVGVRVTHRFWLFAGFALLYGLVEAMNGNWAIIYMGGVLRATAGLAAVALTSFWAAATAGRVLFAGVERWLPSRDTLRLLPWIIGCAFVATATVPTSLPLLAVASFALAGLGCSALLPLTISLGDRDAPAGVVIASYQIGYGLAAFGIGPLHGRVGMSLRLLFGCGAAIALALAALSELIARGARTRS